MRTLVFAVALLLALPAAAQMQRSEPPPVQMDRSLLVELFQIIRDAEHPTRSYGEVNALVAELERCVQDKGERCEVVKADTPDAEDSE